MCQKLRCAVFYGHFKLSSRPQFLEFAHCQDIKLFSLTREKCVILNPGSKAKERFKFMRGDIIYETSSSRIPSGFWSRVSCNFNCDESALEKEKKETPNKIPSEFQKIIW